MTINPTDLLIAPPTMPDQRFRGTVLMIISHNDSGTVALCLNQPTDITTEDMPEIRDPQVFNPLNHPIYWGGPICPESIWMLHSREWDSANTMDVGDDLKISSDMAMLQEIMGGACPNHFRLMHGFASWEAGQLEAELAGTGPWNRNQSWLITQCPDLEILLECPVEELWTMATGLCAQNAVSSWL